MDGWHLGGVDSSKLSRLVGLLECEMDPSGYEVWGRGVLEDGNTRRTKRVCRGKKKRRRARKEKN